MARKINGVVHPLIERNLRVGLLGSPYFWGSVDFKQWKTDGVDFSLIAYGQTKASHEQDLLFIADDHPDDPATDWIAKPNSASIPELVVPADWQWSITPAGLTDQFNFELEKTLTQVWDLLHIHDEKYLDINKAIGKYAVEVSRISRLMNLPQIHIENQALNHLITCPWRNSYELEIAISRMVFYTSNEVLKETYVKDQVHKFGTSVRGVNNCEDPNSLLRSYVSDLLSNYPSGICLEILKATMTPFTMQKSASLSHSDQRSTRKRKAA